MSEQAPRKLVINVSPEVSAALAKLRQGWETPDAVLRRLLNLPEKQRKTKDSE
jgi:hypothetical protein